MATATPRTPEQQAALQKAAGYNVPTPTPVTAPAPKPSPTSTTGLPKTNANNNISGQIKPITQTAVPQTLTPAAAKPSTPLPAGTTNAYPNAQGSWINSPTQATPPPSATPLPSQGTSTSTTPPPAAGTAAPATGTTATDQGTTDLTTAEQSWEAGQNGVKQDLLDQKNSDIAMIQADAAARMEALKTAQDNLQTLQQQQVAQIGEATAASQAANDAALQKQESAVKAAQTETDQKYLELKAAQSLENKRAQIRQETQLGMLGGTFSSAGAADIEDTIVQGDQALNNLGLSNVASTKSFNDQLTGFYNDYRTANLNIQQYKMDKVNESYGNLMTAIASIQADASSSEEDKEKNILAAESNYNQGVAQINTDVLNARYQLAQDVAARADKMKTDAVAASKEQTNEANLTRDDARAAIQNIITTYPTDALASMTDAQKAQLANLEKQAGYPEGLAASGIASMKEQLSDAKINQMNIGNDQKQQLIDLKAKLGTKINAFTDDKGNVTIAYSDPVTQQTTAIPMGEIGKAGSPWQLGLDGQGNSILVNRNTGTMQTANTNPQQMTGDPFSVPNGSDGGECGEFVDDHLGKRIIPDSYDGKKKLINSNTPTVGSVFVTSAPGSAAANGHVGFVEAAGTNPKTGNPGVYVKDSNWVGHHKVGEHWFDQSQIDGYISTTGTQNQATNQAAPAAPSNILQALTSFLGGKTASAPAPEDMSTKDLADAMTVMNKQAGTPKATNFYNNMSRAGLITQYKDALSSQDTARKKAEADAAKAAGDNSPLF